MTEETQEWVDFAEDDWQVCKRELRVREKPSYRAVCFHAQQCIEKYLKAHLTEASVYFPKTHHLSDLLELALPIAPEWDTWRDALDTLSQYAVTIRYPGYRVSQENAAEASELCDTLRGVLRTALGMEV